MKSKSAQKIAKAQAARLAAAITSREADAASNRAGLTRVMFKKAKKAYRQARKSAKRAAKRAKQAQQKFAKLAKYLKRSKPKTARKPKAKRPALKTKPAAKPKAVVAKKPRVRLAPPAAPIQLPGDSNSATSQVA